MVWGASSVSTLPVTVTGSRHSMRCHNETTGVHIHGCEASWSTDAASIKRGLGS